MEGIEIGADAFLSKPIDPAELSAQIKVMLRIKSAEDKLRSEKVDLEKLVVARTKNLYETNKKLRFEITGHKKAEEKLKESEKSLRELTAYLQSAREQERTSIARELHDELGQSLTALNMDVSWLQKHFGQDQKNLREKTQTMSSLLKETIKAVQKISSELRPGQLDDLGLPAAVEWYTGEFEARTGIKCRLNIEYREEDIDKDISTCIFRILQESLTNVARHSKASHVEVLLTKKDNTIELVVKDNGVGISERQLVDSKSFGLIGMKERTNFLGGEVKIEGNKQKGTTVSVQIPL